MSNDILLSLIEIGIGIIVETIILGLIFQLMSNRATQDTESNIQKEMSRIEAQNKFDFQLIMKEIKGTRDDLLNEIKSKD